MSICWRRGAAAAVCLLGLSFAPAPAGADASGAGSLARAWRDPASSLAERVTRARGQALQLGVWNLDPAARAVVARGFAGGPAERAEAAVAVSPDLPAAHMALARARYLAGSEPIGALRSVFDALWAIPRHPEAAFWFGGSLLWILAGGLLAGGLLFLVLAAAWVAPRAAHDLGDRVAGDMPAVARAPLLAGLVLLPLALGEGLLGLAAACFGLAFCYAGLRQRAVLAAAAALLLAGGWPVARLAGTALASFPSDPVAEVAVAAGQGSVSGSDAARVAFSLQGDPLAERALARHARRAGHLAEADARYQRLLRGDGVDAALLNNAANVRLELGHMETALELYDRSLQLATSPVVLFNLSQAHGRAFRVEELTLALERAQQIDSALVSELTALQGAHPKGFVVDLPIPPAVLWARVQAGDAGAVFARDFRSGAAPGWLGRSPVRAAGAFAAAGIFGGCLALAFRRSRRCPRCGTRLCPRCDPPGGPELCDGCTSLFQHPETTDRALRTARLAALRERERRMARVCGVAACAVPGAAGLLAGGPARGLLGAVLCGLAACAVLQRGGAVPDPLVAGAAAPVAFLGLAAVALLGHGLLAATAMAGRREI